MSLKALTKNQKGFTIIEVMIVLAIAGLIILVVFLAVPALQRNSRNTQRKNDVNALLGGLQEWINNNNGDLPERTNAASGSEITEAIANVNFGYYDEATEIYWNGQQAGVSATAAVELKTATPTPATAQTPDVQDKDHIYIWSSAKCDDDDPDGTGTKNSIAIAYALEIGSGAVTGDKQCQES